MKENNIKQKRPNYCGLSLYAHCKKIEKKGKLFCKSCSLKGVNKCVIIKLEGIMACGKSTIAGIIHSHLKEKNYNVAMFEGRPDKEVIEHFSKIYDVIIIDP